MKRRLMGRSKFKEEEKRTEESPHKNDYNAKNNVAYWIANKKRLHENVQYKIWNTRVEYRRNSVGEAVAEEIIYEPIYIMFSWEDRYKGKTSAPLSFHIEPDEFRNNLDKLLIIENKDDWKDSVRKDLFA